ncbi:MAG: hypothetical protein MMC33_010487 [Icmadophila ericetorum]|nr:hypothetical protein [Icmadophila ericetorum]
MLDPLFPPPVVLVDLFTPISRALNLNTLPLHVHEMIGSLSFYFFLGSTISPRLSTWLFPRTYPHLSRKTQINWDIHVVSQFQSLLVNALALWVIFADKERKDLSWEGRIFGYTGAEGLVQAFVAGYFLWDLVMCVVYIDIQGLGPLAHAVSAVIVTGLGFRPFGMYYGMAFVLYELSTPFLNIHWFLDKLHMTGSHAQLYNGITLLFVFFMCRLVWGSYVTVQIYADLRRVVQRRVEGEIITGADTEKPISLDTGLLALRGTQLPGKHTLPMWLIVAYVGSNTMLMVLNFYWFSRMIQAVTKRFVKKKPRKD